MSLFMLDTDSISYALRGHGNVAAQLERRHPSEICVSAVSVAELRFGAERRRSKRIHAAIDGFLSGVQIMAFDEEAAARFGVLGSALASKGAPIGQMDTLIAAHAVACRATLVTHNLRHFSRVPGLRVESWV